MVFATCSARAAKCRRVSAWGDQSIEPPSRMPRSNSAPGEPGGSPGAELLRGILLGGSIDWSPQAETLLHFAARAEHVAKTIRPAIQAGTWVVCDRFFDSTLAYQGYGQGADQGFIASLIGLLGIAPDLTMVLDVPETVAAERMRQRGGDADRYERLDAAFH